jgi:hypothetical protein
MLHCSSDIAETLGFQNVEHFRLQLERHQADFIEEYRSAVRGFHQTYLARLGVGKCSALVPEQLGLHQGGRNIRAVNGDKGTLGGGALSVDHSSNEILAGAGLASDQQGGSGSRHAIQQAENLLHRLAFSN